MIVQAKTTSLVKDTSKQVPSFNYLTLDLCCCCSALALACICATGYLVLMLRKSVRGLMNECVYVRNECGF